MIALLTTLRPPAESGPDPIVRAAAEAGCDAVSPGPDCLLPDLPRVAAAAAAAGLGVGPVWMPLVERRPSPSSRIPRLASTQRDERAAAVSMSRRVMQAAADFGVRLLIVGVSQIDLGTAERDLHVAIRRGELDEDAGRELRAAALGERRVSSQPILDACRWCTESLLREAERFGATLAFEMAGAPWQAPSPVELQQLLQDFRGASLGVLWAPAAIDSLAAVDVHVAEQRRGELAAAAVAVLASEAVGVEADYLPGLGETDLGVGFARVGRAVPAIITGRPDSSQRELGRAVERVRACAAERLYAPAT